MPIFRHFGAFHCRQPFYADADAAIISPLFDDGQRRWLPPFHAAAVSPLLLFLLRAITIISLSMLPTPFSAAVFELLFRQSGSLLMRDIFHVFAY
jgi:hypothetical protein